MGSSSESDARQALVEVGRRLYETGMIVAAEGNLSLRLDAGRILVTPSGISKGRMGPDDLVVVDAQGKHLQGRLRATSELLMHLSVYERRPEIAACVHSHAPYATAFAAVGEPLPEHVLPEMVQFVGGIPLTEYAPPGTAAVPQSLEPYLADHDAFLLRNHGLLTVGTTLDDAYSRHERVEHYARIIWLARQLGTPAPLAAAEVDRLNQLRRKQQWVE
ncbi:MAG: class II aldolase/adducin family protein [Candidatus Zixiibacteriota bacterium]